MSVYPELSVYPYYFSIRINREMSSKEIRTSTMLRLVFVLQFICFVLSSTLCSAQTDPDRPSRRCKLLRNAHNDSNFPTFCTRYYDGSSDGRDGYYNGSMLNGLQMALSSSINRFDREDHLNPCRDLMLNYICQYFFPSCNQATGEITAVCNRTCVLLTNNENCSTLREIVNEELEQESITSTGDSCIRTYHSFVNPPPVSENCLAIEDTLNETLPITCIEIPRDSPCRPQLQYLFHAPVAVTAAEEVLFQEFERLFDQVDPLSSCVAFLNIVICAFGLPACNPRTGKILPICPSNCSAVVSNLAACTERFRNNPEFSVLNGFLDMFVCSEPQTYFMFPVQYLETSDPNECFAILTNDAMPEVKSDDNNDNNTTIIIAVVVVACFIVVVVIIVVTAMFCVKKKKKLTRYTARHNEYSEQPRYHAHDDHLDLNLTYANNASSPYLPPREMKGGLDDILKTSKSSLLLEVNNFLDYVQDKFSEVLLPVDTITKQGLLGKGAFGVVHKGELKAPDGSIKVVAIKTIKSGSLDAMKNLVAESSIMKTFDHRNVLPLLGICIDYDDEDILKVVMPFMANGDLRTFLKDSRVSPNNTQEYPKELSEEILMRMCFDIAKGMEYLAEKRFIHRDLAARNCMVDKFLSIKIADFGLAKDVYSTEYYRVDKHTTLPVKWMSLESLLDGYFDEKTDVWSYGITCWEIFSLGRLPYPGVDNANVITLLKSGKRLEKPELCPSKLHEIITSTWLEDPDERPTFAAIVQKLSSNFTIIYELEHAIKDTEDTAESNGYISLLPNVNS